MSEIFSRLMDTVGNGTGARNANVNGLAVPVECKFEANTVYDVSRLIVQIRDTGMLRAQGYGAGPELENGIGLELRRANGPDIDFMDGVLVKNNADWGRFAYDIEVSDFGSGDNFVRARWTFMEAGEALRMQQGDYLVATIRDDLSNLVGHYFCLQGIRL